MSDKKFPSKRNKNKSTFKNSKKSKNFDKVLGDSSSKKRSVHKVPEQRRNRINDGSASINHQKQSNRKTAQKDHLSANQIWIYGKHPVKTILLNQKRKIFKIFATKSNQTELDKFFEQNDLKIDKDIISLVTSDEIISNFDMDNIVHQGLAVLCSKLSFISDNEFLLQLKKETPKHILILDQLTDPHNIGAIIRSAVAFGVKDIIIPKQNFGGESPTICKSSSGAIENANIILAGNINNLILKLKEMDYWIAGLDGCGSDDLNDIKKYDNICLIVGSEGGGIRSLVKKNCDLLVNIPILSDVESLNASTAAAIALYKLSN